MKVNVSLILGFLLTTATNVCAQDSTEHTTLQILPRLHSAGYFPFTGALLNQGAVADVNIFYEKKSVGFFLFQSVDLGHRHSYANYLQPGIFATVKLHRTFKARGFFGYIFSQANGFRDDGDSDFYAATTFYWDPAKHISLQGTVLFYDFTIQRKLANRLLLSISYPKFKIEAFLWSRTVLEEGRHAISGSIAVTVPVIKLNEKSAIQTTTAYMGYLTKYKPSFALSQGLILTLAVPINVLP